jgi:hypothetical protein
MFPCTLSPEFFVQGTQSLRLPRKDKQAQAQSTKGIERRGKELMLALGRSKEDTSLMMMIPKKCGSSF